MFDQPNYEDSAKSTVSNRHHKHSNIEYLDVYVYSFDQSLNLDTDESYTLTVRCHFADCTVHHQRPIVSMHKQHSMRQTFCMPDSLNQLVTVCSLDHELADNKLTASIFIGDMQ